ncbi:unnamed protein product [Rhizoctonia solani]|uniref:Uncharacterized protein n=1 Tax=Rhizoctonia solani TaxID=456999 RepID=A0A8H3GU49_9AGAM|nr:unnamed protein product [Rhizoctonia solani]
MLRSIVSKHREEIPLARTSISRQTLDGLAKLDLLGILIFIVGFGLIDFHMKILWVPDIHRQPGEVAMLVIGFILAIPVFSVWELCYSPYPLMPKWVFQNRGVLCGVSAAFCAHLVNMFAWGVVSDQPHWDLGLVNNLYEAIWLMGRGLFGPLYGYVFFVSRRYRISLVFGSSALVGLCIVGLVVALFSDYIVNLMYLWGVFQLLSAANNSAIHLATTVGSQASVSHSDLSTLIGLTDSLMRFGSTLSTRVWDTYTPLFYPIPIVLFALAMGFAILCVVTSYFMPAYILGDEHNAVEHERKEDVILDDSDPTAEALVATAEVMNAVAGYLT